MYLVTGGAGFIGSAVVRSLVHGTSTPVVNVDKLTYAANPVSLADISSNPRHVLERVDICDALAVRRVFDTYRPSAVLHLAAESHVDRSIDAPADFVQTNLVGTSTLLAEARRYWHRLPSERAASFRFVIVSTDEVFGSLGAHGQFSEQSRYAPTSPYSATKAGADHLARAWQRTYGLPVIVTYSSNNFGPRQFPEKLIPLAVLAALAGEPIPVYGAGENVRDWMYVEDHAEALVSVLARGRAGESYAIAAGNERRNIDVVTAICDVVDSMAPSAEPRRNLIRFVEDRPGHDYRYALDSSKARRELGWAPRHTFESALTETVRWYLDNRSWWEPVIERAGYGNRIGLGSLGGPG
jgi:dTDP-glucose 4,6-dehydratase